MQLDEQMNECAFWDTLHVQLLDKLGHNLFPELFLCTSCSLVRYEIYLALIQDLREVGLLALMEHVDLSQLLCWPLQYASHMIHPEFSSQQALRSTSSLLACQL